MNTDVAFDVNFRFVILLSSMELTGVGAGAT